MVRFLGSPCGTDRRNDVMAAATRTTAHASVLSGCVRASFSVILYLYRQLRCASPRSLHWKACACNALCYTFFACRLGRVPRPPPCCLVLVFHCSMKEDASATIASWNGGKLTAVLPAAACACCTKFATCWFWNSSYYRRHH